MKTRERFENKVARAPRLPFFGVLRLGRGHKSIGDLEVEDVTGSVVGKSSDLGRLMRARKSFLCAAGVVVWGMATTSLQAALTWNYFAQGSTVTLRQELPPTDDLPKSGDSSLALTFTTDGTTTDLEGATGTVSFIVQEIVSASLNIEGTVVNLLSGPVQEADGGSHLSSAAGANTFVWDLETESVQTGNVLRSAAKWSSYEGYGVPSFITFGSSDVNQAGNGVFYEGEVVRYSFTPSTSYSFAPVPEPGEWGLIFGLGTLILVGVRRRMGHGLCEVG